jgi:predicted proteasome-type protease
MTEVKNINISSQIYEKIEEKIRDPLIGCENVEEYVKLILEKALDIEYKESTKSEDEKVEEKCSLLEGEWLNQNPINFHEKRFLVLQKK